MTGLHNQPKSVSPNLVLDDCDGFALTLLYTLADKKLWRFWWLLVTFQACFWHVTTARGAGHLVLWYRGMWADNTMSDWYVTSDMPHTRRFPWPWPAVALKLLIGKLKLCQYIFAPKSSLNPDMV